MGCGVWTSLKNAKYPVPVTRHVKMASDTLELHPFDNGLEALAETLVTDQLVELDVALPDGRTLHGLPATMGQSKINLSSDVHLLLPAAPLSLSAAVVGQQQPFRFAWADGKKPGFGNRGGGEPWKIVMIFQQELDGKAAPELAKAATQQQRQVRM